jgi:hypothetical protein
MAILILDEGGTDFEMEYESIGEYRERLDFARVKTAQFLVGGAEVMVNNGQSVISSLAVIRGNLFYMINWNPICVLWNQLE